jgi:hypothetical protein
MPNDGSFDRSVFKIEVTGTEARHYDLLMNVYNHGLELLLKKADCDFVDSTTKYNTEE